MKALIKMTLKQIKENKVFRIISNKYLIILVIFVVWMGFFDENSYLNHRELNQEIDKLEDANEYYKEQIEMDQKVIDNLNDPDSLEKYAREEYKMKKENEEIYIIEYDTVEKD
jgi:cell division protein DivIC